MSIDITVTFATVEEAAAFLSGTSRTTAAPEVAKATEATAAAKPAAKKTKAAEPEVAKTEPVKAEVDGALDFAAIRAIIENNTAVNGLDHSKKILADLGFIKASAIPEAKYPEVAAKFKAALKTAPAAEAEDDDLMG